MDSLVCRTGIDPVGSLFALTMRGSGVFSNILMTAENNQNMFLMLWSQLSGQGDTVTAALKCFLVVGSAPTQLQRQPRLILSAL